MEKKEWSVQELLSKSARYCATAEHCSQEVIDKLFQWGASRPQQQEVLQYLEENKYIDEQRYCAAFVHDKVCYQAWGRRKIEAALKAKNLPDKYIYEALLDIDTREYNHNLECLISQKKGLERDKIIRFLLQRGYTMDEILEKLFV